MKNILVFIVVLLIAIPSYSQRKRIKVLEQPIKKVQTIPSPQEFITTKFDDSIEQLPKNFLGHDIAKVHDSLRSLPLKKSEFESSAEYNSRITGLSESRLFGNLSFGSTLAFSYFSDQRFGIDSVEANYDADKKLLSVSIRSGPGSIKSNLSSKLYNSSDFHSLTVFQSSARNLGNYIGVNGYGVRTKVLKGEIDKYEIIFPNCVGKTKANPYNKEEETILSTSDVILNLDVPPLEAIDLKYNLGVLIIGNLTPPYSNSERGLLSAATVKSPTELWIQTRSLFLNVNSMWIYSRQTGKVYKRIPKCSLKPSVSSYDSSSDNYHYFF